MNQTAQNLASYGRNGDSTLVHMSPQEVSGLQALARNNGTTMTINPHTGLPEAFSLGRLLPMLVGAGLNIASGGTLTPLTAGLLTGGLGAVATGSLKEGLMMGLGAAGGAGLAGSMSSLAAGSSSTLPANAAAGSPSVMSGAGSGVTIPTKAISTAQPGQLVNYDALSKIGPNAPPLPPLQGTAAGTFDAAGNYVQGSAGINPINYGFTSVPPVNTAVTPGMTSATLNQTPVFDIAQYQNPHIVSPQPAIVNSAPVAPVKLQTTIADNPRANIAFDQSGIRSADFKPAVDAVDYKVQLNRPQEIVSLKPTMTDRFNRVVAGGEKAFGSMDSAGEFLGSNKMNLAMAAAPVLSEEPELPPEEESYIRPYTLDVENLSDRPASPSGIEEERLRYKYTAGTPYKAAQGGIIAFAQGGNTPDGQEMNTNPAMMRRMDEMQVPPFAGIMDPSRMKDIYGMSGQGYAEGGETGRREVRKKINRMDDPYVFAAYQSGRGLYDAALQNFAAGGLSNVPRFLSGGGDGMSDSIPASINNRQPARLADGEFVIPADVVSHLGNGSSKAGAKQLYAMMDRIRAERTGKKKQAPAVNPRKMMPA